ncbi:LLM class flavin-dependent oxidoreductase [Streptomyces sp. NPDC056528]|uniref:LLM class flavin-dependent oxidoreductase n=1 Tax=Streptomyces sp. NPDC056528 TaxID=3345854 RepID=UPI0036771859
MHSTPAEFNRKISDIARWTDSLGFRGLLIFTDHDVVDQWAAAQMLIQRSERLVPLVAAQPPYMHPYTVARMVTSLAYLYGRQVDLNLVTGGNRYRLRSIGARLDHDERYDQLVEYGHVIRRLLTEREPVTHSGRHYDLTEATLPSPLPADLLPRMFVAGSSSACDKAQQELGVARLRYPAPLAEYDPGAGELEGTGIRIGVIARDTHEEAWRVARKRFPDDRDGARLHKVASRLSDSAWMQELAQEARTAGDAESAYWLQPLRTFREYCPYVVGSHAEVGEVLAGYADLGVRTVILNVPEDEDDLGHAALALRTAVSSRS